MIKSSILKAKIKRSGIEFKETFVWEQIFDEFCSNQSVNLLLDISEEIVVYYKRKEDNYRWVLTNKRLFIPSELTTIILTDLIKVDFKNVIERPESKMKNNRLNLYTKETTYLIYLEEKTWHLFYSIFNFIISE